MKKTFLLLLMCFIVVQAQDFVRETKKQNDLRMQWWREARFGMFIHWGLYSIPAGEWNGETNFGEWIRTSAQIPLEVYEKFVPQFNPIKFDAEAWVKIAKYAGMKYIVITSKHHDGFALFDSKVSEFDIMATPFKRDILKELAEACRKHGIKICWYHSIMDWYHPDYLPRREWEKTRTTEGAEFDRYVTYMKAQLKELLTNYGDISVLWFDGEWENTWNDKRGFDLYNYVRTLQPNIIINNRVGASRNDMQGFSKDGGFSGDFGTPEQQIPATGLPGVDWETCMTMNDHWGYNKNNHNWKSTKEIIHMLADIASKGGNYLLNVGPTAEGLFPQPSIDRLKEIGDWMQINGEAIYGTKASPFKNLTWGRCTQKQIKNGTRLYLHVFEWPVDGKLVVPGIFNKVKKASLLSDKVNRSLATLRKEDAIEISVPIEAPDKNNSVLVLDVIGEPEINNPPIIESEASIFIEDINVKAIAESKMVQLRYTLDGTIPTTASPKVIGTIKINETCTLSVRGFKEGKPLSETSKAIFAKVKPVNSVYLNNIQNGVSFKYYEGSWNQLPIFTNLKPIDEGITNNFNLEKRKQADHFGFEFTAYINIPKDDVYKFSIVSDDGSKLFIGETLVVDNDFLHGAVEKEGLIALKAGYHPIKVQFFEKTGGDELKVFFKSSSFTKKQIPDNMLFIKK